MEKEKERRRKGMVYYSDTMLCDIIIEGNYEKMAPQDKS